MITAAKIRRYMLVRTQMSLITGLLVWGFAKLVGLQLAAEWGVIAFALNYIPFIGPLIATVFPTAFAATQFESWQSVVIVFACLNLIQFIVGSYVEPRVSGNCAFDLALGRPVRRFLLELFVGHLRRVHRCADHNRCPDLLRPAPLVPLA